MTRNDFILAWGTSVADLQDDARYQETLERIDGLTPAQFLITDDGSVRIPKDLYISKSLIVAGSVFKGWDTRTTESTINFRGSKVLPIYIVDATTFILERDLFIDGNLIISQDATYQEDAAAEYVATRQEAKFGNATNGYVAPTFVIRGNVFVRGDVYVGEDQIPYAGVKRYNDFIIGSCNIVEGAIKPRHLDLSSVTEKIGIGNYMPQYLLDVSGSLGAQTIYENGHTLDTKYVQITDLIAQSNQTLSNIAALSNEVFTSISALSNETFMAISALSNETLVDIFTLSNETFMAISALSNETLVDISALSNQAFYEINQIKNTMTLSNVDATYLLKNYSVSNIKIANQALTMDKINPINLSGIGTKLLTDSNVLIKGLATIQGTLTVDNLNLIGATTIINTETQVTDQLIITNAGTAPALRVEQSGLGKNIAEFYDTEGGSMVIADTGLVGIGTTLPTERLDVVGNVKATSFSGSGADLTNIPTSSLVGSIATSSLTGSISDSQITSLDYSKLTNVSVTNAQIASLDYSKVTNVSVTNAQIASGIDASKVTVGTLPLAQVPTIGNAKISDVAFSKVSGVSVTNSQLAGGIDLTTKVTGILPISNGGIGTTTSTGSGSLVLHSSPSIKQPSLDAGAVGGNANDELLLTSMTCTNTNVGNLRFFEKRHTAGTTWETVSTRIQKRIDVTDMGYIEFNPKDGHYGLAFGQGNTEYIRIKNGGNVGIGKTSPSSALDVNGTVTATTFSGDGSGLTGFTATQIPDLSADKITSGTLSASRLPSTGNGVTVQGNFGQWENHAPYNDFNTKPNYWGWNFVGASTNGPNAESPQWYRQTVSLGAPYNADQYNLEIACPRYELSKAGQMFVRTLDQDALGAVRSGWVQVGSRQLSDFIVDGKVGIGTTSPSKKLEIVSAGFGNTLFKATTEYPRIYHESAHAVVSTVYEYETGKNVYWGEDTDTGAYYFRGRTVYAPTFSGSGSSLTSLNAGNISSGSLSIDRIADGTITAAKLASGVIPTVTDSGWTKSGTSIYNTTASDKVAIGTTTPISTLTIHDQVADKHTFDHSGAPLTVTNPTPTSTTVLNDKLPVMHLCRQGTGGQAYGARTTFALSRYENAGEGHSVGSRTRLDIQLAHNNYDTVDVMSIRSDGSVGIGTPTPAQQLDVNGRIRLSGNGDRFIEIGAGRTDNNYAYVDLIGDATYTDYGLRLLRGNTGPNAWSELYHRGVGDFSIACAEAAALRFITSSVERVRINSGGGISVSGKGVLDLGYGVAGREANAGKIGYETFTNGSLDIVGAGTGYPRKIKLFDDVNIQSGLTVGTNAIVNGSVGIGTISPQSALHLSSSSSVYATYTYIQPNTNIELRMGADTEGAFVSSYYDHDLSFNVNNSTAIKIAKTTRNIGIGIANPTAKLHLSQTGTGDIFRVDDAVSDTTPFIIKDNGNVGIGYTNPIYPLDVYGKARTRGMFGIKPYVQTWNLPEGLCRTRKMYQQTGPDLLNAACSTAGQGNAAFTFNTGFQNDVYLSIITSPTITASLDIHTTYNALAENYTLYHSRFWIDWEKRVFLSDSGLCKFVITHDNGCKVFVNGGLVYSNTGVATNMIILPYTSQLSVEIISYNQVGGQSLSIEITVLDNRYD